MKTKVLAVALLFGAWAVLATAGGGDDAKKEMEKLQGTWKLTSEVDSGQNIPVDPNETFTFKGEDLINKVGNKATDEFKVKIIPGKTPKEIDLIPQKEPNKGVPSPAIYKIEGNKLIVCVNFAPGSKRPGGFDSNQTNRNIILTMEKSDAAKKGEK
jgi:uncharacterized protein (TIGR03067 family)